VTVAGAWMVWHLRSQASVAELRDRRLPAH